MCSWSITEIVKKCLRYLVENIVSIMEPNNEEVTDYCKKLLRVQFEGESNKAGKEADKNEDDRPDNLGCIVEKMYRVMTEAGEEFTGNEKEFNDLLEIVIKRRERKSDDATEHREKMLRDKERFIQLLKQKKDRYSDCLSKEHNSYWGTRQQLRFGKVVGDWIDRDNGPLDPIFGVLLSPTGGRTGPGDDTFIHWLLFDNDGCFAYHSAVHDAFGYLLTNHNIGPGYKYLNAASMFRTENPMAEQAAGIVFWRRILRKERDFVDGECEIH